MDQSTGWIGLLGAIGAHAYRERPFGMWALTAIFAGMSAKQREKALFRNEIAHAKLKLAARERALARATVAARAAKLDARESRVTRLQAGVQRTREQQARRDAERAAADRAARIKAERLRAQKIAMNAGSSVHGTRLAFDRVYRGIQQ